MFIKIKNLSLDIKDQRLAFENILNAIREHQHFIWIPKSDIKQLLQDKPAIFNFLSETQADTLEKLYDKIGDDGHQYIESLSVILEIDFLRNDIENVCTENRITTSYQNYISGSSLRETVLLVENLNDGKFYKELGEIYHTRLYSTIPRLFLKMHCMQGGGNTTNDTFIQESSTLQPLLCVLDSDKEHPRKTKYGDTAQKVLDEKNKLTTNKIVNVFILPVRAIENLMPINVLKAIRKDGELGLVFEKGNEEYRKYIKCKEQRSKSDTSRYKDNQYICLEELREKHCEDRSLSYFWKPFYEKYQSNTQQIVYVNLHSDLIVGKKFLASCIEVIKKNVSIREDLIKDESELWNLVAHQIFSWAFSCSIDTNKA